MKQRASHLESSNILQQKNICLGTAYLKDLKYEVRSHKIKVTKRQYYQQH